MWKPPGENSPEPEQKASIAKASMWGRLQPRGWNPAPRLAAQRHRGKIQPQRPDVINVAKIAGPGCAWHPEDQGDVLLVRDVRRQHHRVGLTLPRRDGPGRQYASIGNHG